MEDTFYQCKANIVHGNLRYKQNQTISQEEFEKVPEQFKFKFRKLHPPERTEIEKLHQDILDLKEASK